jgi:hypothetical protein
MRAFLRNNSLSLVFLGLFLAALVFQSIAGLADFNEDQVRHGDPQMSYGRYLVSSEFATAVMENWQSEYLQFTLYVLLTVWLVQRGSPESKEVDKTGGESDEEQKVGEHAEPGSPRWARIGGVRRKLYENSLVIVMAAIWIGTWLAQSLTGVTEYNTDRLDHHEAPVSWAAYLTKPDFWEKTLQNWQSEFLAVGSMAILAVYLRQRGSPESKPVGAPHHATGADG